jgi:D-arabinose 1-dehydrogenase-like Zn-dependent alcohol dehydrogenase
MQSMAAEQCGDVMCFCTSVDLSAALMLRDDAATRCVIGTEARDRGRTITAVRAVFYDAFREAPSVREVADLTAPDDGVVVRVEATGLCRSDWHAWRGHDPDIRLPHVPGHELAGTIVEVGRDVARWKAGDRVVVPFICACGVCGPCLAGEPQVCDDQYQPGFTHWGSFAELVAIHRAELNLVRLPDELDFVTAAGLGCRFATAHRAVVAQGRVAPGEWVAVYGCGGVGLSAVMIAVAAGAKVVAIDVSRAALAAAVELGATVTIDASAGDVVARVVEATEGGAHLSIDALGSAAMLASISEGRLGPSRLVGRKITLEKAPEALMAMVGPAVGSGMTMIVPLGDT